MLLLHTSVWDYTSVNLLALKFKAQIDFNSFSNSIIDFGDIVPRISAWVVDLSSLVPVKSIKRATMYQTTKNRNSVWRLTNALKTGKFLIHHYLEITNKHLEIHGYSGIFTDVLHKVPLFIEIVRMALQCTQIHTHPHMSSNV